MKIDSTFLQCSQSQRILIKREPSVLLALKTESIQLRRCNSDELSILGHVLFVHISEKQIVYSLFCFHR